MLEDRKNGTYFTGDWRAARAYLCDWYSSIAEGEHEGGYAVREMDDDGNPQMWGMSETGSREEAWRYFAGADFGPPDEGYDPQALRDALAPYSEKE